MIKIKQELENLNDLSKDTHSIQVQKLLKPKEWISAL